jgi:hypothetical protein
MAASFIVDVVVHAVGTRRRSRESKSDAESAAARKRAVAVE